jgi:hypothetical protein
MKNLTTEFYGEIDMTENATESTSTIDDSVTGNKVTLKLEGTGFLSRREMRIWGLSEVTIKYLIAQTIENQKSPAQQVNELVAKEIAAAV